MVNIYGFIFILEIKMEKDSNIIRMIFLGGFLMVGIGVNIVDEKIWLWLIVEKLCVVSSVEIDFINVVLGGYFIFEFYGKFWS